MNSMTREELLDLPVSIDVETAGRALGMGRTRAYQAAKAGEFPIPVLKLGRSYRVVTADLWRLLGVAPQTNEAAPAGTGTAPELNPRQDVQVTPKDTSARHLTAA